MNKIAFAFFFLLCSGLAIGHPGHDHQSIAGATAQTSHAIATAAWVAVGLLGLTGLSLATMKYLKSK